MIGELIGDFKGKITGVRILSGEGTEMSVNRSVRIFGIELLMRQPAFFQGSPMES